MHTAMSNILLHEPYMARCLELAASRARWVAPNPMVGAVVVKAGEIISEGTHHGYGKPHAEVHAIQNVSNPTTLTESTLYVNLEPCNHQGKTPPCVEAILAAKIPEVVIGMRDPNPEVSGAGIQRLIENGITVHHGILEDQCRELNRRFVTFHTEQRPHIILKWAESVDGFIAPPDGKRVWISSEESRQLVHQWRAEEQAIMVGTNTAVLDNPALTVRGTDGRNPLRVVLDRTRRIPTGHQLFDGSTPTVLFTATNTSSLKAEKIDCEVLPFNEELLSQVLKHLYQRQITSLFVEGGAKLLSSFLSEQLWDEVRVFTGRKLLSEGVVAPQLAHHRHVSERAVGTDQLKIYRPAT